MGNRHLAEFCGDADLRADVARAIASAYDGDTYYIRPDVEDVIAEALAFVRMELRDRAEDQGRCNKVDECTAQAVVLARLADWLEVA